MGAAKILDSFRDWDCTIFNFCAQASFGKSALLRHGIISHFGKMIIVYRVLGGGEEGLF